ncbi:cytosine permease [Streptomyces asiaticus]
MRDQREVRGLDTMNPPIPSADDPASSGAPTTETVVNQFGKVETAGVDFIPEHAGHGKPLDLFFVWASVGTNFLYVLFGGGLVASGLTIGQAFLVAGLASLFWIAPGITAMSGPSSGTPSAIVTRAVYGIRGNRIFGAGVNWLLVIVFEGAALASGTLAGVALLDFLGVKQQNWVTAAVAVVLGIAVFVISFFGHATIIRVSVYLSGASAVFMLGLAAFVLPKASTTVHASAAPLEGSSFWSVFFGGLVLLAAFPLTWGTSADFARHLPSNTPGHKVVAWTAFGGALPQFALTSLGILAGTAVDANNLQLSLKEILPRYVLCGSAMGPLASGPGMTVAPCRRHDNAVAFVGSGRLSRCADIEAGAVGAGDLDPVLPSRAGGPGRRGRRPKGETPPVAVRAVRRVLRPRHVSLPAGGLP